MRAGENSVRSARESVRERSHQPAKTNHGLFDPCHFQRVPDVGLAARDHGLADFPFEQINSVMGGARHYLSHT